MMIQKEYHSLQYFIRQRQVKSLYRQFLKAAKDIPDVDVKKSVLIQIELEFRKNILISDKSTVATLFKDANRSLDSIRDLSRPKSTFSSSWLNNADEEDKRGRVGTGWPWSR